jgi:hypothetical protein
VLSAFSGQLFSNEFRNPGTMSMVGNAHPTFFPDP